MVTIKADRVTIKDVARACGVSSATVSYVLNGKRVLLPETREKVMRVVRELDYHPSAVAQGLSRKRMNTIGILFGVVDTVVVVNHPYAANILQGVLTAAAAGGATITLDTYNGTATVPASVTVNERSTTATFPITTRANSGPYTNYVYATFSNGIYQKVPLNITAAPPLLLALRPVPVISKCRFPGQLLAIPT